MGRRNSREMAMKLIYQIEINKNDWENQIEFALDDYEKQDKDKLFILELIYGVNKNIIEIDNRIKEYSKGWKIDRIPKIDLSILRLSIFEIIYRDDIPFTVSVNEAVELAKKYSTNESGAFINGILGRLAQK